MIKENIKTVNDLKKVMEDRLIGQKIDYTSCWHIQLDRVLRDFGDFETNNKDRQSCNIIYTGGSSYRDNIVICGLTIHFRKELRKGCRSWERGYDYYVKSLEFRTEDGNILIEDVIKNTLENRKKAEEIKAQKEMSFIEKLKEYGFDDIDALTNFIRKYATKEQRQQIRWNL